MGKIATRIAFVLPGPSLGKYEESFGLRAPPLAVAYLAGVARDKGIDARFFDASVSRKPEETVIPEIVDYNPDICAFVINASSLAGQAATLAGRLKKSSCMLVAGGHHASFSYPLLLRRGFDAVFLGEGERSFSEFLDRLRKGDDWRLTRGLAYNLNDKIVNTGLPRPIENLDELPMPAFDVFDKKLYTAVLLDRNSSLITLETSRGCPYKCEYCSVTKMWGAKWRLKSIERVIRELRKVKELGYRWVFFVDDNFIIPARNIISQRVELLNRIIKEGLNSLKLIVQLRADFVARNEWIASLLHEAGVRVAFLGIESGDPATLRNMRKNLIPDESAKAVSALSSNGIIVHGGFMLGAPYESEESMNRTVRFAVNLIDYGLDSAQFSIYTPLPGTDAFKRAAIKNELLTLDWSFYDCLHPVMRTNVSPAKLFFKQRWANYYFFIAKGLKSLRKGRLLSKPRTEKDAYLRSGTIFLARRIPRYLLGLIKLPFTALLISRKLKKELSAEEKEEANQILKATIEIEAMQKQLAKSMASHVLKA